MSTENERRSRIGIFLAFGLVMVLSPGLCQLVQARSDTNSYGQDIRGTRIVNFEPPADKGEPEDTVMGGSRGNCDQTAASSAEQMTLLMPESNYGLTVAGHPKLFIYIPATRARALFVQIKDESDREHYKMIVPIKSGIVKIPLPTTAPSLEIGETYQLFAVMLCEYDPEQEDIDPEQPYSLNDPWTQAEIKRIAANSTIGGNQDSIPALQRAALYAENGIWVDTLAIMAELRQTKPSDPTIAREWTQLLTAAGLESTIAQKLVE